MSNGPGYQLKLQADASLQIVNTNSDNPAIVFGYATGSIFTSSNGVNNGVLWALSGMLDDGTGYNALRIYDSSFTALNMFLLPDYVSKFSSPTVVDGHCYFATHAGMVFSYGCTGSNCPTLPPSPSATPTHRSNTTNSTTQTPTATPAAPVVAGANVNSASIVGPVVGGAVGGFVLILVAAVVGRYLVTHRAPAARRNPFRPVNNNGGAGQRGVSEQTALPVGGGGDTQVAQLAAPGSAATTEV